jgi:hypothetical protein|tara:strand:- start:103 stop:1323 length:1221 start_codon:yes stop_codon:yes gene_type:complete
MNYTSYSDFLKFFDIPEKIEYSEYKSKLKLLAKYGETYDEAKLFVEWAEQSEHWTDELIEDFCRRCYDVFVVSPELFLMNWYDSHIKQTDRQNISGITPCETNGIIDGSKKVEYGRIIKNLFWEDIYSTYTTNSMGLPTTYEVLKKCVEYPFIYRMWKQPSSQKFVAKDKKLNSSLFGILRGTSSKASIFNPNTAGYIISNILKSEKLFTPCLGWASYIIGSFSANVKHYVGVDVIPHVVDKCKQLCEEHTSNPFIGDDLKFDFYCCPSEQLDKRHNFIETYKEYFDSVFFSPPYFDLEVYEGGEQSIESFPNYQDWLKGYWEETVKICYSVLEKGGTFSFVIVPQYRSKNETIFIGTDLSDIVKKYFTEIEVKQIHWKTQTSIAPAKSGKQKKLGNYENLYLFTK